jgi:hypothetical protein
MLKVRTTNIYTKEDAKYSRRFLKCWCLRGNCSHYNKKLCDINYEDSIKDVQRKLREIIKSALSGKLTQRNLKWLSGEYAKTSEDI